ncbi:MAG: thioredoxin domain-containing protein [Gaiella sp.]
MNRLADATSPYLLQHATNPVDWHHWGDEAFAEARRRDRPLLVSVGYSACHWCHVMEHESFADPSIAALMNELFVNVKVDREERPDVDALTMDACVTMTGQGGWPTTVFLTPDGRPFFAGTYYPPTPRHGIPSFAQLCQAVAAAWDERRSDLEQQAERLVAALGEAARLAPMGEPLGPALLEAAEEGLARAFEPAFGGFGGVPKFPPASAVELLLRRGTPRALELARRTLDGMAAGGMWDVVGGGFHRYSVDARWLVPHFEKMLYDNALLTSAYLHAAVVTGEPRYRRVAEQTVDYLLRELLLPDGGLASSQDADTEGVEGLTYTWTQEEWIGLGLDPGLLEPFEHGRCIVRGELDDDTRGRLRELRDGRPQPGLDDKVIASWNGLALAALAEAGRRLERDDVVAAAVGVATFLLERLRAADGRMLRSWRAGRVSGTGFLDDHADVAHGLLELHLATGDVRWLHEARAIALNAVELFADEARGGFFLAPSDGEPLATRPKPLDDEPTPSGSSMLASVLVRLARLWGEPALEERAVAALRLVAPAFERAPRHFAWALCALDLHLAEPRELAIVGSLADPVARRALAPFAPRTVVAIGPADDVPLLAGKGLVDGRTAVYACERFVCRAPVTEPDLLG